MKKCPFCAEEIQDEAIKCRYCLQFIEPINTMPVNVKVPWYFRSGSILVGFFCVGPFVLPLVWLHPTHSLRKKIIISIIILVATFAVVKLTAFALGQISDYYKEIGNVLGY